MTDLEKHHKFMSFLDTMNHHNVDYGRLIQAVKDGFQACHPIPTEEEPAPIVEDIDAENMNQLSAEEIDQQKIIEQEKIKTLDDLKIVNEKAKEIGQTLNELKEKTDENVENTKM